jgi:peptidoglycan/xylan/chitin deacetylase (PgdA/CDA1 family)
MREAAGEKKDFEIDSKSREMARRTLYRLTFAGGLLLGATGVSVVNAKSSETDSGPFSHTQLYEDGEMFHYDFLTEDICEIPYVEGEPVSGFILEEKDSSILDWENLEDEGSLKTRMEEGIISEEKIEEVVEQKGIELIELEELLGSEVKEIFSLVPNLTLDQEGNLFFENDREELRPVLLLETERHLTYPYEPVQDVKFFVIHYDSAPLKLVSGDYRTVFNTLNGLNRKEKPSVHFCVDPYPITDDLTQEDGLGLILSQQPNEIPYKGRHVQIGINLETGAEDVDRVKTARLYEEVGIGSRFVNFVDSGEKDFNSYSLGVEQIGTNYSLNFPEQFPPNQQISNVLALSKAVASRYDLTVWDIVGHNEIQEKSDPGDEYMLTLRYLLGLSHAQDNSEFPEDFLGGDSPSEFLLKLRNYSIAKMGEGRYEVWNEIYGLDEVLRELELKQESSNVVEKSHYWEEISEEEKIFLANNEISFGDRERPVVIMTYDDGGREEYMEHIMNVYEADDLRTTFFITGQWVERNPELVKDMLDRGFEIGCHGWDHAEMTNLGKEGARKQIEDFLLAMYDVDSNYQVNLIRFPYGSRTQGLREIAAEFGLQSIMWSHGSGGMDDTTFDNVMRHLDWGSIILSHSTRYYDVYETERILQGLLEQGYEVTTVTEGMAAEDVYKK